MTNAANFLCSFRIMIWFVSFCSLSMAAALAAAPNEPEGIQIEQANAEPCQVSAANKDGNKPCLNTITALYRGLDGPVDYISARQLSEMACASRIAEGCNFLGAMQEDGNGGSQDFAAADSSFELACLYGSGGGCFNRAQLIMNDKSPVKDLIVARASYIKACDENVASACNNYGAMLLNGKGVEKDPIAARAMFDVACGAGNFDGCTNFGEMLINAPLQEGEAERGLNLLTSACEQQNVRACSLKGSIYHYGRLGKEEFARDYQAARAAYETACRGGNTEACWRIAQFLYEGKGGPQNLPEARGLFGALCKQDIGTACFFYGDMLKTGEGGPQDSQGGKKAITKGCELGDPAACAADRGKNK